MLLLLLLLLLLLMLAAAAAAAAAAAPIVSREQMAAAAAAAAAGAFANATTATGNTPAESGRPTSPAKPGGVVRTFRQRERDAEQHPQFSQAREWCSAHVAAACLWRPFPIHWTPCRNLDPCPRAPQKSDTWCRLAT